MLLDKFMTGIKKSSEVYKINGKPTNILLCVAGLWDDVNISMLSDEDFEEVWFLYPVALMLVCYESFLGHNSRVMNSWDLL